MSSLGLFPDPEPGPLLVELPEYVVGVEEIVGGEVLLSWVVAFRDLNKPQIPMINKINKMNPIISAVLNFLVFGEFS